MEQLTEAYLDRLSAVYDAGYRAGIKFARSGRRIQHEYTTTGLVHAWTGGWIRGLDDTLTEEADVSAALRIAAKHIARQQK